MKNKNKLFDLLIFSLIIIALIIIIPKSNKGKIKAGNKENSKVIYSANNDSLFMELFAKTE